MLTLAQYKIKYPNETYLVGSFASHGIGRIISEGFLEFTEDTAPCWGGPFSGNHARFVISDYTNLVFESGPNLGKRKLDVWDENFKELVRKFESGFHPELDYVTYPREVPTNRKPIMFKMLGNDDSSYSKFYSKESKALEELNLFIGNEPCDFHEVIDGFDFIFTN